MHINACDEAGVDVRLLSSFNLVKMVRRRLLLREKRLSENLYFDYGDAITLASFKGFFY